MIIVKYFYVNAHNLIIPEEMGIIFYFFNEMNQGQVLRDWLTEKKK